MKRAVVFAVTVLFLLLMLNVSAFADTVFTDTIEDGLPLAFKYSDHMYYQYNEDLECTTLVKQSDTGSPSTTEYIVYRTESAIKGFLLDCMHVNGLGDGLTDLQVLVSPDFSEWTEISLKATEFKFDDEIYIDYDHAYWVTSTVSNKAAIPENCTYIKIVFKPYTLPESCPWNTVIDTVKINLAGGAGQPDTDTDSTDDNTDVSSDVNSADTNSDTHPTENTGKSDGDSANTTLIIVCVCAGCVVILAVCATLIILGKNKKKSEVGAETKVDSEQENK